MTKIAINGFGRIGRLTFRQLLQRSNIEVVAINDLADTKTLSHLLKFDSVHGRLDAEIEHSEHSISVNGKSIEVYSERDPSKLPWKSLEVEIVLECTGIFREPQKMNLHKQAGAKKVLLSAPGRGEMKTIVLGVNDDQLTKDDSLISNASCTTNCLAPMAKVLNDNFGIVKGFMTTTHAYTADQNLQDAPHKDLRRARAAALSIIPTSTGAAKAIGLVLPELDGKLDGMALRVPTPSGSAVDLTVELGREVNSQEVNAAFQKAGSTSLKSIMQYSSDPLVSADIVGNTHSCIFDSELTRTNGNMVKVLAWYDNEAGYSGRLADLLERIANL